ncbi:NAD(P)/FAD-dependent oxidoreductase [Humidisolicoccus flavus]|uniref:NAD(P)/FAD-dependent oxidoreductase n=1 Tax=Humidisolicoccus flavus TaxID=3111414 RepID=UPI0032475102
MNQNSQSLGQPPQQWDVVILGGGVAGLSAALMLGRAGRRTLVVDEGNPRNRFASHMHGVLGNEGTPPFELLSRGRGEVAKYGVEFAEGSAAAVRDAEDGLAIRLADGAELHARALVVATGMTDELAPIPGLAERWGKTVLHCPYCHGWEVRGQRLGVLAISAMGVHQAQLVRQWSETVTLFTNGLDILDEATIARLRSRNVEIVTEPVVEIRGDGDAMSGVATANGSVVPIGALFTAGVARPHDDFLEDLGLERTDNPMGNFLQVDPFGKTSHGRIWAVGNVANPGATVPVSMGTGSMAGAMANAVLMTEDFDRAEAASIDADSETVGAQS